MTAAVSLAVLGVKTASRRRPTATSISPTIPIVTPVVSIASLYFENERKIYYENESGIDCEIVYDERVENTSDL
jgi:hypothetical protein